MNRREALSAITQMGAASLLLPGCAGQVAARGFSPRSSDLVREENAKPGTRDWMLKNPRIEKSVKYRCPWIEGYVSRASVKAGEPLSFHVSANPASRFTIDLYRMGHYGGAGARLVARLGTYAGRPQTEPEMGERRLRECRWEACETLSVPRDWPSGVYLGKLTAETEGVDSYVIFVVRDDREADYLIQVSDTTWHAYNRWPSQFSLYDNGKHAWYWGAGVDVSFDRPYGRYCQFGDPPLSTGSGEFLLWEFPLSFWLESKGLDVTYISNLDTHRDPAGLRRAKGFFSVGHDEYYSLDMFHNLRGAIADGLSAAFLSGNTCCGVIDVKPSADGRPDRIISRVDRFGPRDDKGDATFIEMKSLPRAAPNENLLIGARSTGPVMGGAAWICAKPDHWLFERTGMKEGDGVPGLVGWEFHGEPAEIPGLEVVATGKTRGGAGEGVYTATVYPGGKGNFVFNAATCWWTDGLSEPPGYLRPKAYEPRFGPDPRVQRITENVLRRMV